ncbi:DUF971 domain-containing protein [Granulicella sibirica]|uniref:Gamma-butyrobetaine hydroxylase-like N-terminal domain-containing protein n=1 Tax=Granulicella sibirica TaxID=2479048 RepID=A0A4Q0T2W1_9BACT|nr:DUF971 domain-containing protein [Granulicella sibirica]RXH57973.1 hypothetical protein GRAN_1283 [Granulicella sibirica]
MSHEGIRIVSQEQAEREAQPEVKLPVDAVTPAKVRVMKTEGTGVEIDWRDGHRSKWTFAWLREACPCATCHEARDADGRKPGIPKAQPATLLPMFKEKIRPLEANAVGKYALRFKWNDGHESGIYSWEYLRRLPEGAEV